MGAGAGGDIQVVQQGSTVCGGTGEWVPLAGILCNKPMGRNVSKSLIIVVLGQDHQYRIALPCHTISGFGFALTG